MESRAKGIRGRSRPLTNSEKFLITILGIIIVFWLSFRFVFDPQAARMEELEVDRSLYEDQIAEHNRILRSEESIKEELKTLTAEKDEIVSNFFPTLDQAQIIYLLNDLLIDDKVNTSDMNFSRAVTETKGELAIQRMDINIPLNGQYEGVFDTVKALEKSPRRILISSLNLDKDDELKGSITLKIYSLEGLAETDKVIIPIDIFKDGNLKTPFTPYKDYREPVETSEPADSTGPSQPSTPLPSDSDETNGQSGKGPEQTDRPEDKDDTEDSLVLLYDFEDENYDFVSFGQGVEGSLAPSSISRSGNHSLMFEFDIEASEEPNGVYVDLSNNNILLDEAADSIGMWVYSYGNSPRILGLIVEGQDKEPIDLKLVEGISWLGWSKIEAELPEDSNLYPLKVEGIYYELPSGRADSGVLLMDSLEAFHPVYEDYVVRRGDTIFGISMMRYGTVSYVDEILELNHMKRSDILSIGRVLALKKR